MRCITYESNKEKVEGEIDKNVPQCMKHLIGGVTIQDITRQANQGQKYAND